MTDFFTVFNGLTHWQIDLAVLLLLWEGAIFTIFPEETVLLGLGLLVNEGKLHFLEAVAVAQLGLLPADAALWLFGRAIAAGCVKSPLLQRLARIGGTEKARILLTTHGARLIFVTRFIPFLRAPVYLAAGLGQGRLKQFLLADWLGCCLHGPALIWLGGRLAAHSGSPLEAYRLVLALGLLILLGSVLVVAVRRLVAHVPAQSKHISIQS